MSPLIVMLYSGFVTSAIAVTLLLRMILRLRRSVEGLSNEAHQAHERDRQQVNEIHHLRGEVQALLQRAQQGSPRPNPPLSSRQKSGGSSGSSPVGAMPASKYSRWTKPALLDEVRRVGIGSSLTTKSRAELIELLDDFEAMVTLGIQESDLVVPADSQLTPSRKQVDAARADLVALHKELGDTG